MNQKTEQKAKKKSAVITSIITSIVLFGLFFLSFKYYDPPIENAIAINFGYDEQGIGTEESTPAEGIQNDNRASVSENTPTASKPNRVEEKILTQEDESPVVKPKTEKQQPQKTITPSQSKKNQSNTSTSAIETKNNVKTEAKGQTEEPKLDGRLGGLRDALGGKGNKASSGDGDGSKQGNQGVLEGDPSAENYEGSIAKGTRKLLYKPAVPDFNSCPNNEYGKVVVTYKVASSGTVITNTITFNGKGTNITVNACIKDILRTYIAKFKYSPSNKTSESTNQTFNLKPQ